MSKCLWSVCAVVLVLGSGWGASISRAQPPEAPFDADVGDGETSGGITLSFDIFTGKLSLSFALPWHFWQRVLPDDASVPNKTESTGRPDALRPPRTALIQNGWDEDTLQVAQARAMFEIAERCLKKGDLDKARTCYEEAHLLAPETRYGRRAIQRLTDIDSARINHP